MNLRRVGEIIRGAGEVAVGVLRYPSAWMGLAGVGLMTLSQTEVVRSISPDKVAGITGVGLGVLALIGLTLEISREGRS